MSGPSVAGAPPAPVLHGDAATRLAGAEFEPVSAGRRSQVWKATFADDRPALAVKCPAPDAERADAARREAVELIHAETARLVWLHETLHGRGLVAPELVVAPESEDPDPILVTAWFEGTVDPRLMRTPEVAVENFGRALASLHGASRRIDLDACPFDASLEARLEAAAVRVEAGLVDTSVLEDPYDHYTPEALLERVRRMAAATRPLDDADRVFVHGDLCVSNIIFDPAYSSTVGAVDWGFAGVGDRHQDLAITARSLSRNLSGEVLPDFFAAYGLSEPDLLRIETYVTLEELF